MNPLGTKDMNGEIRWILVIVKRSFIVALDLDKKSLINKKFFLGEHALSGYLDRCVCLRLLSKQAEDELSNPTRPQIRALFHSGGHWKHTVHEEPRKGMSKACLVNGTLDSLEPITLHVKRLACGFIYLVSCSICGTRLS